MKRDDHEIAHFTLVPHLSGRQFGPTPRPSNVLNFVGSDPSKGQLFMHIHVASRMAAHRVLFPSTGNRFNTAMTPASVLAFVVSSNWFTCRRCSSDVVTWLSSLTKMPVNWLLASPGKIKCRDRTPSSGGKDPDKSVLIKVTCPTRVPGFGVCCEHHRHREGYRRASTSASKVVCTGRIRFNAQNPSTLGDLDTQRDQEQLRSIPRCRLLERCTRVAMDLAPVAHSAGVEIMPSLLGPSPSNAWCWMKPNVAHQAAYPHEIPNGWTHMRTQNCTGGANVR